MQRLYRSLVVLGSAWASAAGASVVINPMPPIPSGVSASVSLFATVPASASDQPRASLQQGKPLADGSGRFAVNDTRGIVYMLNKSGAVQPWFDIRTQDVGFSTAANPVQTGLMSVAFHPNFGIDPDKPGYATFFTFDTTAPTGQNSWGVPGAPVNHENVVREWTVADPTAASADILSTREVLRVAQPYSDHGPGTIAFNPAATAADGDYGKLYIGLGDGGAANDPLDSAQNLASPFGKILRIDPTDPDGAGPKSYSVPADNPFVGKDKACGEVWAYGLRNPQQFSFDATGKMLIADIGQNQIEEVNVGVAGANYGWPKREGTFARGDGKDDYNIYDTPANPGIYTDPVAQYDHEEIFRDGHTLAGIGSAFLYTGAALPELYGKVVLADLVTGRIFYYAPDDAVGGLLAPLSELLLTWDGMPTTMLALAGTAPGATGRVDLRLGLDGDGELYLLTKRDGSIFKLASAVPEPGTWLMMLAGFGLIGVAARRRRSVEILRRT